MYVVRSLLGLVHVMPQSIDKGIIVSSSIQPVQQIKL